MQHNLWLDNALSDKKLVGLVLTVCVRQQLLFCTIEKVEGKFSFGGEFWCDEQFHQQICAEWDSGLEWREEDGKCPNFPPVSYKMTTFCFPFPLKTCWLLVGFILLPAKSFSIAFLKNSVSVLFDFFSCLSEISISSNLDTKCLPCHLSEIIRIIGK